MTFFYVIRVGTYKANYVLNRNKRKVDILNIKNLYYKTLVA